VISYLLSVNWAFTNRSVKNAKVEFIIYCLIGVAGLALTEVGLWFFTERLGIYYMFSKVMAAVVVYLWNFFMRKYVLFK
jgi:putative flippase GtrA